MTEIRTVTTLRKKRDYAEGVKLCREALASGSKTRGELASYIAAAKGLDARDSVMGKGGY